MRALLCAVVVGVMGCDAAPTSVPFALVNNDDVNGVVVTVDFKSGGETNPWHNGTPVVNDYVYPGYWTEGTGFIPNGADGGTFVVLVKDQIGRTLVERSYSLAAADVHPETLPRSSFRVDYWADGGCDAGWASERPHRAPKDGGTDAGL